MLLAASLQPSTSYTNYKYTWCKITYSEQKTITKFHLYTTRKIELSNPWKAVNTCFLMIE